MVLSVNRSSIKHNVTLTISLLPKSYQNWRSWESRFNSTKMSTMLFLMERRENCCLLGLPKLVIASKREIAE
jgi:hypothetical protein